MDEVENQRTWYTTVLVKHNQVRDIVRSTRLRKFFHHVVSAIYAMRIWEDKSHFLEERQS